MTKEHTKGPWVVANGNEVHDQPTRHDEHGARIGNTPNRICVVEYPYADSEGQDANAALIAAAPELRDALDDALGFVIAAKIAGQEGRMASSIPAPFVLETKIRAALAKVRP